jgi:hypothetical protein
MTRVTRRSWRGAGTANAVHRAQRDALVSSEARQRQDLGECEPPIDPGHRNIHCVLSTQARRPAHGERLLSVSRERHAERKHDGQAQAADHDGVGPPKRTGNAAPHTDQERGVGLLQLPVAAIGADRAQRCTAWRGDIERADRPGASGHGYHVARRVADPDFERRTYPAEAG